MLIAVAVEGPTDRAAVGKILATRSLQVDPSRIYETGGKPRLDARLSSYNAAARRSPWLVLRDSDRDGHDCPVTARTMLLPLKRQSLGLCFRLAVRALEAWLLADHEAFSSSFSVSEAVIPRSPEQLKDPKVALVDLCRRSRRAGIRRGMVPVKSGIAKVGPEYTTLISDFCRGPWRPDVAAENAPSLRRALIQIDEMVSSGAWPDSLGAG